MFVKKHRKILLLIISVIAIIVGVYAFNRLPVLQMKASQALTWMRGALHPSGELPTADAADAKAVAQRPFWLPGLMSTPTGSGSATDAVPAKQVATPLPVSTILPAPAFDPRRDYQDWNNCGPATLALALRFWG